MKTLIDAQDICFSVESKAILDRVSVSVQEEEIVTIIGPNGAGKTTLLRILSGLSKPTTGTVTRAADLTIGYMPQKLHLNTTMPLPVRTFLSTSKPTAEAITETAHELGIEKLLDESIHQLSGGEKQRVLLARAILRKPNLLVLDEPAQGVDISGQNRLYELVDRVRRKHHCAVLMVSHDLHLVMANTDRVICLNQHICCEGHPDSVSNDAAYKQLFAESPTPALAPYIHHHDHHHDLHGDVIEGQHGKGCTHD